MTVCTSSTVRTRWLVADSTLNIADALGRRAVVVVGHTHCGGVGAALRIGAKREIRFDEDAVFARAAPVEEWVAPIADRVTAHHLEIAGELGKNEDPEKVAKAINVLAEDNVRAQVEAIANTDAVQGSWISQFDPDAEESATNYRPVTVHGWMYDIETGLMRDLGCSVSVASLGAANGGK